MTWKKPLCSGVRGLFLGDFVRFSMMRPGEFGDAYLPSRKPKLGESASQAWTTIARFLNAAEAGYFAHELKLTRNIPVTLRAEEDFDAVSGHWSTGFVLSVPQAWAERAAETLQELVHLSESEDYLPERVSPAREYERKSTARSQPFDPFAEEDYFTESPAIHWVPIVVTLAAGSLAIWGIKILWEPARPQAAPIKAPRDVLWDVMTTPDGRKWVQHDSAGRPTRELEIPPLGHEAILREDNDGDQVFERTQRIKRP